MKDTPKKTQGEVKMERYIEDLIRNKEFLRSIKKLRRTREDVGWEYEKLTEEQKAKQKHFDNEIIEILNDYERLRKRIKKLFEDDYRRIKSSISEAYNLDDMQIGYIEILCDPNLKRHVETAKSFAEFDMCKVFDLHDDEMKPEFKGDEIIHLNMRRQFLLRAYPVGIFIHPKASKRDVIDFVEKRWNWIENNFLRGYTEKKLKHGKRKHDQKMLDFIWSNRSLVPKKLKIKLDKEFPKHGLVYYEISKILQLEADKRLGILT